MTISLFKELKRRNVIKVSVAYLVLAWVVVQVTAAAVPALNMPDWVNTVVFYFGLIGFPFVIFFSWVFEITPEGVKRESEITAEESITMHTGRKLDFGIIALLTIALSYFVYESQFNNKPEFASNDDKAINTEQYSDTQNTAKSSNQETEVVSIAVLPFSDMSQNKDQEYFSDGISEEILNVLAKIPNLQVTSRSSAFSFKGKDIIISDVAKTLGVKNVLEGSIRKSGNKIRITAQLIEAESDIHLWSETYDRELDDIFAIQDEIATAIVVALKSKLGLEQQIAVVESINVESYNDYLFAKQISAKQTPDNLKTAIDLFKAILVKEPDYIQAKVALVLASLQSERFLENHDERLKIEQENDLLIKQQLNSEMSEHTNIAELNGVIGFHHLLRFRYDQAKGYLDNAISLNKNYAQAYLWRADIAYEKNQFLDMLSDRETAYKLDPMSLEISRALASDYRSFWRPDDAKNVIDKMFVLYPDHPDAYIARASNQSAHGHYAEATITMEKAYLAHPESEVFKDWLAWLYIFLDQREPVEKMNLDWTAFEFARRDKDYSKSAELLEIGFKSEKADEWIFPASDLYLELAELKKLKVVLEKQIANFDERNIPWTKRCRPHFMASLKAVSMNDSLESMMSKCYQKTEQRLKDGYLCPCSWFNLVSFAIIDERYDDAIKRATEWLDNGDSYYRLDTDALFTRLKDRPEYSELIKRNEEQLQRQIRLYKSLSATGP